MNSTYQSGWVGGVVGVNSDTMEACCFAGDSMTGNGYTGGVAGSHNGSAITNCYWQPGSGYSAAIGERPGNASCYEIGKDGITMETAEAAIQAAVSKWMAENPDVLRNTVRSNEFADTLLKMFGLD